jgi:UDP-N-acetylmuramoylalanine--D-glutamate ligase
VAVLLNVTPDHLDYHGSMAAYTADKARIFANQLPGDVAVIDVDDEGSAAMTPLAASRGAQTLTVSRMTTQKQGAYLRDGMIVFDDGSGPLDVLPAADLAIRGEHNVSNALAAVAVVASMGADPGSLGRGLMSFRPLEHRLEPAGVVGGVEYFNDSKATNPDAVIKALTAFSGQPVVLLLGGRNKGVDLRPLAAVAAAQCKAVVMFGEAAAEFAAALSGADVSRSSVATLADAVEAASRLAAPGDAVLLSPGCTSFDEFADYTERGRRFKRFVSLMAGGEPS